MSEPISTTHVWTANDGWQLLVEDHGNTVTLRFIHVDDSEHAFVLDLDSRRYEVARQILPPGRRHALLLGEHVAEIARLMSAKTGVEP